MSGEQNGRSWRTKKHMAVWRTTPAFLRSTIACEVSGPDTPATADFTLHPLPSLTEGLMQVPRANIPLPAAGFL